MAKVVCGIKDADDAIGIARLTDQSICISQWTGNEKSYEEAIKLALSEPYKE